GLNRRIAARDVSISMFDDRFDQPTINREIDRQMEQSARVDELTTTPSQEANELGERRPLTGKGTAPPPGPPQSVATVVFGEPTAAQQQEVQARQQQAHAGWAAMEQLHPHPGLCIGKDTGMTEQILIGNKSVKGTLAADPELVKSKNGRDVAAVTLIETLPGQQADQVEYSVGIIAAGDVEYVLNTLHAGDELAVSGQH